MAISWYSMHRSASEYCRSEGIFSDLANWRNCAKIVMGCPLRKDLDVVNTRIVRVPRTLIC